MALSSADYRQALLSAETDLQSARASVAEWLITQAPAINEASAYVRSVAPALLACERRAEELHSLLEDPRVGLAARAIAKAESEQLLAEANELERIAAAAEKALEARELLATAEEKRSVEPIEAVRLLREAEEKFRGLPPSFQCVADAADAARVAGKAIQSALKIALLDYFPVGSLRVSRQETSAATPKLPDLLCALRSISEQLLTVSLNELTARIRSAVLSPLLQSVNAQLQFSESQPGNASALIGSSVSMSLLTPSIPLENAIALLKFLQSAFGDCADTRKLLANALWPELQAYVHERYVIDSLPSIYAELQHYDAHKRVVELATLASSIGVDNAGELVSLAQDVDGNFVKALAGKTLSSLRATLMDERWDTVRVGEYDPLAEDNSHLYENSPLAFPRCLVSTKSRACLSAVRALLEASVSTNPPTSTALWLHARDAAALYAALVHYAHRTRLAQVPRFGLLYYTDCMYLAHEILTVGLPYLSRDVPGMSFIDISETTRELADEYFKELITQNQNEALELLAEAEGFANTHLPGPRAHAESALKRIVHLCQQLTVLSSDVLPSHMHRALAESVTERAFSWVVSAVLRLTDIDQHARLSELLLDLQPLAADSERNLPSLERFKLLVALLDARLVDIPRMYEEGKLKAFTSKELRALVMALFSDSPNRKDCLQRLGS